MRWNYYFQVLLSGTMLNLYYYTGLFEKTGSALQAKYIDSRQMVTTTFGERLGKTFQTLDNSLHRDNSIGIGRRPVEGGGGFRQPSSLRLHITHPIVDSDAGSRIKNFSATMHESKGPHSVSPSHKHPRIYIEKYAGDCVLALGHTTVYLLRQLLALQVV